MSRRGQPYDGGRSTISLKHIRDELRLLVSVSHESSLISASNVDKLGMSPPSTHIASGLRTRSHSSGRSGTDLARKHDIQTSKYIRYYSILQYYNVLYDRYDM